MKKILALLFISITCKSQERIVIQNGGSLAALTDITTLTATQSVANKSFLNGLFLRQPNNVNTNRGINMLDRDIAVGYPIPYLIPSTSGKSLALDLMPSGAPSAGLTTQIDVLDGDMSDNNTAAAHFGRLGVSSAGIEFGNYAFTGNGATQLPSLFTMNGLIYMAGTIDRKVVIGDKTTANFSLDVYVSSNNPSITQWYNTTTGTTSNDGTKIGILADGEALILNTENKPISFWTNGTQYMTLKSSGVLNLAVTTNYASNAAAISGGLVTGDLYRNGDALQVVH